MINGQLMQVVTQANQIAAQSTVVTTGNIARNQPRMQIVENPNNQQVLQVAVQPSVQLVAQTVVTADSPKDNKEVEKKAKIK